MRKCHILLNLMTKVVRQKNCFLLMRQNYSFWFMSPCIPVRCNTNLADQIISLIIRKLHVNMILSNFHTDFSSILRGKKQLFSKMLTAVTCLAVFYQTMRKHCWDLPVFLLSPQCCWAKCLVCTPDTEDLPEEPQSTVYVKGKQTTIHLTSS